MPAELAVAEPGIGCPIAEVAPEHLCRPSDLGAVAKVPGDRSACGTGMGAPVVRTVLVRADERPPVEGLGQQRPQPRTEGVLVERWIGRGKVDEVRRDDVARKVAPEGEGPSAGLGTDCSLQGGDDVGPVAGTADPGIDEALGERGDVRGLVLIRDVRRADRRVGAGLERGPGGTAGRSREKLGSRHEDGVGGRRGGTHAGDDQDRTEGQQEGHDVHDQRWDDSTRRPLGAARERRHDAPLYLDAAGGGERRLSGTRRGTVRDVTGSWGEPAVSAGLGGRRPLRQR